MPEFTPDPAPLPDVIIVGGGLAGLSAAWNLSRQRRRVVLLEGRRKLGGRASSFVDPETGESIDHCQHVAMGCCTQFLSFCEELGLSRFLSIERELYFLDVAGRMSAFRPNHWPPPLHLLPALAGLKHLAWREKWSIIRALRRLMSPWPTEVDSSVGQTESRAVRFADWLQGAGQSESLIERFWLPVVVSALSESPDRIDVLHARKVFIEGFMATRDGWRVHLPTVPLSTFYDHARSILEQQGVTFRMETRVVSLEHSAGPECLPALPPVVRCHSGETLQARCVLLSVPCWQVRDLIPDAWCDSQVVRRLAEIETAPITSVHLWYAAPITPLPHCVLIGRLSQWIFRRPQGPEPFAIGPVAHAPDSVSPTPVVYQVVISNSRELLNSSPGQIAARVEQDLQEAFPQARHVPLLRSRVITERRAVFSPLPGIEALRPGPRTPWPGVYWCGDWIATGWPSTMESAVRSGALAAEAIVQDHPFDNRTGSGSRLA